MDILIVLKNIGIIVGIIFSILIILFIIMVIKNIIKSILLINNIENLLFDYYKENKENNYIWFEYMNDSGLGKIYNNGTDENPELYVLCIYKNNSIQNLPLSKIDKCIPLKFKTYNTDEEKIINKFKDKNED